MMKLSLPIRKLISLRPGEVILIVTVAVLTGLGGVSGLVYPSNYSPLLFLGGILATLILIVWLAKPEWALFTALFLVFLPIGLIPVNIHSLLNRSVTILAAGVWFVQLLRDHKKIVWTGPAVFMLFFLLWSSVTLLWVEKMEPAMNALQVYSLRFLLFLFLIPNEVSTKKEVEGLMKTLALSGWVLMLSVARTLLLEGYTAGSRFKVFSENENGAGMLALITMAGVIWQVLQPSNNQWILRKLMTAVFILLTFCFIAMSGSRGSALSLVVTLCIFWVWKPLRSWGKFALLITIVALIFTPTIFTTLVQRFAIERGDTPLGGREVLWQAAMQMIKDHPLQGVGIGNAPYKVVTYVETGISVIERESAAIHNPILTVWSETAILGIFFYLGIVISAFYSFVRQYLKFRSLHTHEFTHYFALVSSITFGYMVSWFKGGGIESHYSFFLILALLTLPSVLNVAIPEAIPSSHQNP